MSSVLIIDYKGYKQIAKVISEKLFDRFNIQIIKGNNKDEIIQIDDEDERIKYIHPSISLLGDLGYFETKNTTSHKIFKTKNNSVIFYINDFMGFFVYELILNDITSLKTDNNKKIEKEVKTILANKNDDIESKCLTLSDVIDIIISKDNRDIEEVIQNIDLNLL